MGTVPPRSARPLPVLAAALALAAAGTLTVGGARLIEIETAPGFGADEALRLAASVEQASQHVVAAAIVAAARERQLPIGAASDVREAMGSGVGGVVEGRRVRAGSHDFVFGSPPASAWSRRTLRRASLRSALTVFVAVDGTPAGAILLADELRRNHIDCRPRAKRDAGKVALIGRGAVEIPAYLPSQMVPAVFSTGTPTALPYSVHEPS